MRALVTRSTGLLGNNLVRTLMDAGHEVWALARSQEKAQRELGDTAARVVLGDIRNVASKSPQLATARLRGRTGFRSKLAMECLKPESFRLRANPSASGP
jgi:nucleoside-diphosphate-sugar epimerase